PSILTRASRPTQAHGDSAGGACGAAAVAARAPVRGEVPGHPAQRLQRPAARGGAAHPPAPREPPGGGRSRRQQPRRGGAGGERGLGLLASLWATNGARSRACSLARSPSAALPPPFIPSIPCASV